MPHPREQPDRSGLSAAERATRRRLRDGKPATAVSAPLILGACALGLLALAILVYVALPAHLVESAPEPAVYPERQLVRNPLREALAALQDTAGRYLAHDRDAYLKQAFIQKDSIFRYQLIMADFVNTGNNAYVVRLDNKRRILGIVREDPVLAELLRKASAIYIDVYDQDDAYFFSYDVTPEEVWRE